MIEIFDVSCSLKLCLVFTPRFLQGPTKLPLTQKRFTIARAVNVIVYPAIDGPHAPPAGSDKSNRNSNPGLRCLLWEMHAKDREKEGFSGAPPGGCGDVPAWWKTWVVCALTGTTMRWEEQQQQQLKQRLR